MIKIESIKENEDGSADVSLNIDYDTLVGFAKIGFLKAMADAVEEVEIPKKIRHKKDPLPCTSHLPTYTCPGCDCWKSARTYSS